MDCFSQQHIILPHEADIASLWRLSSAFMVMEDIAGNHATELSLGRLDLLKHNIVWILSKLSIEMTIYPRVYDEITIKTWYASPGRLLIDRFFEFTSATGQLLGAAHSAWVLMDFSTRRVIRPDNSGLTFPDSTTAAPAVAPPSRIRFEGEAPVVCTRNVLYSDVDANGHVNNSRYIDWICDLTDASIYKEKRISKLNISYISESLSGDNVDLRLAGTNDAFYVCGACPPKTIFEAEGCWSSGF